MATPKTSILSISYKNDENSMDNTCHYLKEIKKEIHAALQLPSEDMDKIDHIEWQITLKPEFIVRMYPKKD